MSWHLLQLIGVEADGRESSVDGFCPFRRA